MQEFASFLKKQGIAIKQGIQWPILACVRKKSRYGCTV